MEEKSAYLNRKKNGIGRRFQTRTPSGAMKFLLTIFSQDQTSDKFPLLVHFSIFFTVISNCLLFMQHTVCSGMYLVLLSFPLNRFLVLRDFSNMRRIRRLAPARNGSAICSRQITKLIQFQNPPFSVRLMISAVAHTFPYRKILRQ